MFKHPPAFIYRLFRYVPSRLRHTTYALVLRKVTLGVSAVIRDDTGGVLLVRHTYRLPAWDFPSGLVGHDEQPATALARELGEELGVRATIGTLLHAENHRGMRHLTLYYAATIQGLPRQMGPEVDAWRYVSLEELHTLIGPTAQWLRQVLSGG